MPLVMFGVVFALFGNMFFLNITDKIYSFAFHIANYISGLPGANITVPHISNTALILCITGMLCIIFIVKNNSEKIFMKNINYFVGGTFIFAALIIFSFSFRTVYLLKRKNQPESESGVPHESRYYPPPYPESLCSP